MKKVGIGATAYFGRASYMASVLEVGLAHALMFGEFFIEIRRELLVTKGKCFSRAQYEARFDAFMNGQFAKTMGTIKKRVAALPNIDFELIKRIDEATKRRNFLAHHFWRERSMKFHTMAGRAEMRDELDADAQLFLQFNMDIDAAMKPTRLSLGIKDEILEAYHQKIMKEVENGTYIDD